MVTMPDGILSLTASRADGSGPSRVFDTPLHVGRPNVGDLDKFNRLVAEMFGRNWLTNNGPLVQELETRIAEFLGVKHCVALTNGTVGLELAIRALGLSGEVIVPAHTFVATVHALHWQGIKPVFVDIDPRTQNLDPEAVESAITADTSGILPVHLWGRAAPVAELTAIAEAHGLDLLFDAAHAFGCSTGGQLVGGFGKAEVFSFHATKFFNTLEGGAITTNDGALAEKLRLMRNFGFAGLDNVVHPGINGKMTEVCAAMGLTNLDSLGDIIATNHNNYDAYARGVSEIPHISLLPFDETESNNYQYVVLLVDEECPVSRDSIIEKLHSANVLARKYFWPGCHRMQPYRDLYPDAGRNLPQTEAVEERIIVMPTGTAVDPDTIVQICEIVSDAIVGA